jgi:uncharacterized protein YndB with AHSA1/START domain/ketosteroid isomerase-like protein
VSSQNDLEIVVPFDAPREEVFSNWTDANKIRTWFAPDGFEVTSCSLMAQPGGEWQVQYRAANGVHYLEHGEFSIVDVPERLVFTLTQIEGGRIVLESLVTVTFTSVGLSTRMSFHQTGFDTPVRRDDFRRGWGECFRKLAGSLEKSNLGATASQEPMTMTDETAGTEIRVLLEAWAAAVRRHDMPAIFALHAPDIVMFDLPPPLQANGLEDYKKTWDLFFQYHKVSQAFDIEELNIVADDHVGFAFGIMRALSAFGGGRKDRKITTGRYHTLADRREILGPRLVGLGSGAGEARRLRRADYGEWRVACPKKQCSLVPPSRAHARSRK